MERNYKSLYKKSLIKRRKLQTKYNEALDDLENIGHHWRNIKEHFGFKLTEEINKFTERYESHLKEEINRWKYHYNKVEATLRQKEKEIERLRDQL